MKTHTNIKTKIIVALSAIVLVFATAGCDIDGTQKDNLRTVALGNRMSITQATPNDLNYSLERFNLIRRAYWVNGMRERARSLPCPVEKPLGYIVLMGDAGAVIGKFVVDGKVSSLLNYLTPDSEYYASCTGYNKWLPDVDGSFGRNDNGIFFFTPQGNYVEWKGTYLYTDILFEISDPVLKFKVAQ